MAKNKTSRPWIWIVLLLVVAAGWWGGKASGLFGGAPVAEMKGARVKRGPLTISVLVRGSLSAKDAVSVKSEIEGQTTILSLIPEGTIVKPGDLLCELDSAALIEKKVAQEINVQSAEATYTKASAQYDIQESQNKSDIEAAQRKLDFAKLDIEKYEGLEKRQQLKEADNKIQVADSQEKLAATTAKWSKDLADQGFLTQSELDSDNLKLLSAQTSFEQAQLAKDLLVKFDDPRKRTELDANLEEADRGLDRAKLKAEAMIADYKSGKLSSEAKLKLEREKLQKYIEQLDKTKLRAPAAGMVVYARVESGRMGNDSPIAEGTTVRERQEIMQIPRKSGMVCEGSVHESVLKLVAPGMACRITIDALPGMEFPGEVQSIAVLPDKGSWWSNPNARLYPASVVIKPLADPTPEQIKAYGDMRPGMSCQIEILSAQIEDCLYVPVQCIVLDKGETTAFLHTGAHPEQVRVKVGRSNEKFVEVTEGLKENDEVLLAPPPGFVPAQAEDKPSDMPKAAQMPNAAPGAAPGAAPSAAGANAPPAAPTADGAQDPGQRPRPNFDPANFDPSQLQGRMKERWDAMSEEERAKFLENMKSGNFGGGGNGGGRRGGGRGNRDGGAGGETKPAESSGGGGGK
ncbi:MAG: HlyD family efflux transporter periplasmic adaptor subunit [Planctomycetes bacterium]|nr:HlyD family efflux transporter periplasmic adaptor subunit [Planctomycetota bacterium]